MIYNLNMETIDNTTTVLEVLERAPALLAYHATLVEQASAALDLAKHSLEVSKAKAAIRWQDEKNQMLLKARIEIDELVIDWTNEVIQKKSALKIEEIAHRQIYDRFLSARKIAGMDEMELHAIGGQTIKGALVRDSNGRLVNSTTGEIVG